MTRVFIHYFIFLWLWTGSPLCAADGNDANGRDLSSSLTVSGNLLGMYYVEAIAPPTDSETGAIGGVNAELTTFLDRWMLRGIVDFNFGQTQYIGALQDGTPLNSWTGDAILDLEGVVGYCLSTASDSRAIPYVGFGAHYWSRILTGQGHYSELYEFFYLPIGLRFEKRVSESFEFGIDTALHLNLGGQLFAYLASLGEKDATGSLGPAAGLRIQFPLIFRMSPSLSFKFAPFFEYFGIGVGGPFPVFSTAGVSQGSDNEPASSSYFYGGHAGLTFSF